MHKRLFLQIYAFDKGDTKITTGTGFNIQTNIGNEIKIDENSLTSLAFSHNKKIITLLSVSAQLLAQKQFLLKNNLKLIDKVSESESLSLRH